MKNNKLMFYNITVEIKENNNFEFEFLAQINPPNHDIECYIIKWMGY